MRSYWVPAMGTISLVIERDDVTLEIRFIIKTQGSEHRAD